jgi:cation diffusion facilitator CzcD-associated flavoprotein CzcO
VVIGSGATAVTLVPAMARGGADVTMLQRSPTYVLSMPGRDPLARLLRRLPDKAKFGIVRWKNVLMQIATYQLARRRPKLAKRLIRAATVKSLPEGFPVDEHFGPDYNPWEQRLCLVPNGDLFKVLADGSAEIVTDTIETFTETGIRLASGRELEADIVVSATGLKVIPFGGLKFEVDGRTIDLAQTMSYKALMLSDVPNFMFTVGYTNASWTLKADLVTDYTIRLLEHLDRHGLKYAVPRRDPSVGEKPFIDFNSGYVLRAIEQMPRQGDRAPWLLKQNYLTDLRAIRRDDIDDGVLTFA